MDARIETVLQRLNALSRQDRRWVLERLPDSAKVILLGAGGDTDSDKGGTRPSEVTKQSLAISLEQFPPASMTQLLLNEPAWIGEALTRHADANWSRQVRMQLPSSLRSSVQVLSSAPTSLSAPVLESLQRASLRKLSAMPAMPAAQSDRLDWRQLWSRLRTARWRA